MGSCVSLTSVDAGAGCRNPKLRFDEFWNESDESGDDGALCRVGQADEEEGHIAQDPHCSFRQVCEKNNTASLYHYCCLLNIV